MRPLLVIDSFKGCLSSEEAEEAARKVMLRCGAAAEDITSLPVSDGGEGFCKIVTTQLGGEMVSVLCHDPLGRPITAQYGLVDNGHTAIIESASAVGLGLIEPFMRNPLVLSSYGLGQMISDAIGRGVWDIYVGLGGTATCDGGVGMMQALGVSFYGPGLLKDDSTVVLSDIARIDAADLFSNDVRIHCLCDTDAPFYGPSGAARVFGPQKGLAADKLDAVDSWMKGLNMAIKKAAGRDPQSYPGSGAAGGIGGALCAFMDAEMLRGAAGVLSIVGFDREIRRAAFAGKPYDVIVTGEGRLDSQTLTGKLPWEVLRAARALEKELPEFHPRVVCVAGKVEGWTAGGFDDVIQITPESSFDESGVPYPDALSKATVFLQETLSALLSIS